MIVDFGMRNAECEVRIQDVGCGELANRIDDWDSGCRMW
jgi:hypothetical protein